MPKCCPNCFNDIGLKEFITNKGVNGVCTYCRSERIHCIDPDSVKHLFEFFSYCIELIPPTESTQGSTYAQLIQKHFYIYDDKVINLEYITRDILGDEYTKAQFRLKHDPSKNIELWSEFKNELKFKNRFFPKNSLYSSLFNNITATDRTFTDLLGQLAKPIYSGEEFFRARISEKELKVEGMKMPPIGTASSGRANPVGISYLYLASNLETCIAEVRPSNSSKIRVAKFSLQKDLRVLDLSSPRKDISVTTFEGDQVEQILNYVNLLETLSDELSKPILPDKSTIDYLPTQFLCEFIKSVGEFDGIIFNSSFGHGLNYVFYSQEHFAIDEPELYNVTRTMHEFVKI